MDLFTDPVGLRTRSKDPAFGIGQMIEKNFPGHGLFKGAVKELPTSEFPFYCVEYEDGDSEHIAADALTKFVVVEQQPSAKSARATRPKRKAVLKSRSTNIAKASTSSISTASKKTQRTKRKSSDDDTDSPPIKKPPPKSPVFRRPKRAVTVKKAPSPVKTKSGRIVKSTTVNVGGFEVKKSNNYDVGGESYEFQDSDAPPKKQAKEKKKPTKAVAATKTKSKRPGASKAGIKTASAKRTTSAAERKRAEHNEKVKEREEAAALVRGDFFAENLNVIEKFVDAKVIKALESRSTQVHEKEAPGEEYMQPTLVEGELRDYQLAGLNWMVAMFRRGMPMILGDEMGLGKTLQTISLICHLKETEGRTGPSLVICPLSVLENWISEVKRWAPELSVLRLHANSKELVEIIKSNMFNSGFLSCDIVVTTYDVAKSASTRSLWSRLRFTLCVLDEGHIIKNHESQISQAVRRIQSEGKLVLSGTPTQNNLVELWSLLNFLYPDYFTGASHNIFDLAFDISKNQIDSDILHSVHDMLRLFMLRRMKSEVAKMMPKKVETRVLCPLSKMQIDLYKGLLLNDINMLAETSQQQDQVATDGDAIPKRQPKANVNLKALFIQLRKLCNHPFNIEGVEADPSATTAEELISASGKFAVLDMLLRELFVGGHRVVLFSQFTTNLDIIQHYCELRGYSYCRFDGGTARAMRNHVVKQFNAEGSNTFIFLMTTRSGSMGLNLQSADTCVLFDSDPNPQMDLQAMARVHRLGQKKTVHIYRLISTGTIEERNVERAQKKLYLDQVVNRDSAQTDEKDKSNDPSTDEMLHSLTFGSNAVFGDSNSELNCLPSDKDIRHIVDRTRSEDDSMGNLKGGATQKVGDFDASAELSSTSKLGGIDFAAIREAHWNSGGRKQTEEALISGAQELAKRQVKSRITVVADDEGRAIPVLNANNYDLESGESSVFDRELSGRNHPDNFVEKKREILRSGVHFNSSSLCQVCGEGESLVCCPICPVATHKNCFDEFCREHGCTPPCGVFGQSCPHHRCIKCNKSPSVAGGLLFPCQSCPKSFCDDCLSKESTITGNVGACARFEELGFDSTKHFSYIHCSKECEQFARERFEWTPEGTAKPTLPPEIDVSYAFGKKVTSDVPERPREEERVFNVGDVVDVKARDGKRGGRGRVTKAELVKYEGWLYSVSYSLGGAGHRIESIYISSVDDEDDVRKPREIRKVTYHDMHAWTPTPKKPKAQKKKIVNKARPTDVPPTVPIFAPHGQYDVLLSSMTTSGPLPIVLKHKKAPVLFAGWRKSSASDDENEVQLPPSVFRNVGDIIVAVGGRCVSGLPREQIKRMMRAAVENGSVRLRLQDSRFATRAISELSTEATAVFGKATNSYRCSPVGVIEPSLLADAVRATGLPRDTIIGRAREIAAVKWKARAAAHLKERQEEEKRRLEEEEKKKIEAVAAATNLAPLKDVAFKATKPVRLSDVTADSAFAPSETTKEVVKKPAGVIAKAIKPVRISDISAAKVDGKATCTTPVTVDLTAASSETPPGVYV